MDFWSGYIYEWTSRSFHYLQQGGYVIIPLVFLSIWMWFIIIRKMLFLRQFSRDIDSGIEPADLWKRISSGESLRCKPQTVTFRKVMIRDPEARKKVMEGFIKRQTRWLEKDIGTIFVLASVSPLLGLLGTVTGMITTFGVIYLFGRGNVKGVASGISEALITTQVGLLVAIPGLFMGNYLQRQANRHRERLERLILYSARALNSSNGQENA